MANEPGEGCLVQQTSPKLSHRCAKMIKGTQTLDQRSASVFCYSQSVNGSRSLRKLQVSPHRLTVTGPMEANRCGRILIKLYLWALKSDSHVTAAY